MGNQFERSPRRKKKKKKQPQQRQHHQNGRHRRACNTHAPGTVHQKHDEFFEKERRRHKNRWYS
ncbi:uncharacterized protein LOC143218028 isoform X4 [Lasioglossum baleicum]|uniref:uncharacterized protein LOC143218028 isoform X4 n=1 Tax=Lasioglossum baleicum TaxID=434251 RepID=UPI003FCE3E3E